MSRSRGNKGKKPFGKHRENRTNFSDKKTVSKKTSAKSSNSDEIRLNKYIANSGMCSRREADQQIAIGLVTVNGKVVTEMGFKVKPGDEVRYDGARVTPERKTYVLLNKPKGFATTTSESKGRTVMDLVANATSARIKPIGRLGRNATGLLLFTNDEKVVKKFTNSKTGVARLFHLALDRNLKKEDFDQILNGLTIDGRRIFVEEISYIDGAPKNEIGLRIKNNQDDIRAFKI